MPQLVMVRRGYCGETCSDTLGTGQVKLYIYIYRYESEIIMHFSFSNIKSS